MSELPEGTLRLPRLAADDQRRSIKGKHQLFVAQLREDGHAHSSACSELCAFLHPYESSATDGVWAAAEFLATPD